VNPELGRAWLQVAVFITLVSAALLLFVQPGTAEFVIAVTSLAIGLVFVGIVVFMVKRVNR
jgi:preprotein translocase subunit Sss1